MLQPLNCSSSAAPATSLHFTPGRCCADDSTQCSSFSLDAAVQTLIRSTVLHDTSTQLPLTEFFIGCIFSNDPFDRQGSSSAQGDIGRSWPPQPPDFATTCSLSSSSLAVTCALLPDVSCCSHHRVSNSMPHLQVSIMMPTRAPHMVYLLKRHRCDPVYVQLSQSRPHSHMFVPSMWEHILCAQPLPARKVLVQPLREPTILSRQILVQGLALFLNREPSFFLWSIQT